MSEIDHNDFLSKLEFLSGDRDLFPWLMSLGFTQGTVNRLKKGQAPGGELLRALARTERVSLRWLEEGRGSPYSVSRVVDDAEGQALLAAHLEEEDWDVLMATDDDERFAVILHQPGQYGYKEKMIDYRIVEVIAGGLTLATVNWLMQRSRGNWLLRLTEDEMTRLSTGHMGNMELFGWEDARKQSDGIEPRKESSEGLMRKMKSTLHEVGGADNTRYMATQDPDTGKLFNVREVSADEYDWNKAKIYLEQMSPDQRAALFTIMRSMLRLDDSNTHH